jgi:hypothetical protein
MARDTSNKRPSGNDPARATRLGSALRANLARRKAQARARRESDLPHEAGDARGADEGHSQANARRVDPSKD